MSQDNVEIVRRMFEAYGTRVPESALELLHPEIEYDTTVRPDGKVWQGRDGVRRAVAEWTGTWEDWEMEIERYIDAGGDRVVVLWRERGKAKGSGVGLAQAGVTVLIVREGLIVAMRATIDRQATLRELGLAE